MTDEVSEDGWLDRPAPPLWRINPVITADAGITVPESGATFYVQEANGAWRQIGVADGTQFDIVGEIGGLIYARLHTEAPEPEEVSGGPTAYARRDVEWSPGQDLENGDSMSFTVTFEFASEPPDSESLRILYGGGSEMSISRLGRHQATYLEETPEGDIVERIGAVLNDWDAGYPYSDAMVSPGVRSVEDEFLGDLENWRPSGVIQARPERTFYLATCAGCHGTSPVPFGDERERDEWAEAHTRGTGHEVTLSIATRREEPSGETDWSRWAHVGAITDADYGRFGAREYHGFTPVSEDTRARAQRALAEWEIRRGMIFDLPDRIREALNTDPEGD